MEDMRQNVNKNEGERIKLFHGIYTMAIFAAAAVFFFVGYKTGISSVAAPASVPQLHTEAREEKTVYTVRAENGKLCIYEADSAGTRLIASERISLEVFPSSDRDKLEQGVEFDNMSDAQALFEDFVN